MNVVQALMLLPGEAGGCRDLDEREAHELIAAILDAGTGEFELGAVLALLEQKPLALPELPDYSAALDQRCSRLRAPQGRALPVVFAAYRGVRVSGAVRGRVRGAAALLRRDSAP